MNYKADYSDIINLPRHISLRHRQLTMEERASIFIPFTALEGLAEAIDETEMEMLWNFEQYVENDFDDSDVC